MARYKYFFYYLIFLIGDEVVSINLNGDVTYLDLDNPNKPKRVTRGHNKSITALAVDAANNSFYTGSYDALLYILFFDRFVVKFP